MKIHHIRNATLIIELKNEFILVDPMFGPKGTSTPFSFIRHKARRNPLVDLPDNIIELINKTTHCVITHLHPDHLDQDGVDFLIKNKIAITCHQNDEQKLHEKGLYVKNTVSYWEEKRFLSGKITAIPAKHGYGWVSKLMGNVSGFFIQLDSNQPTVYISSDTIYTNDVKKVFKECKPDISILACGSASLDIGKPLLMTMDDILDFIKDAPGQVIANHMEALNHCPTSRLELKNELEKTNLSEKVNIPEDGESILF